MTDPTPHLKQLRAAPRRVAGDALPGPAELAPTPPEALCHSHDCPVDRVVFDALTALARQAGPDVARGLLNHMAADLRAVSLTLTQALAAADAAEIRKQTHVLVTLAGTAGARRLEQDAQALSRAGHVGNDAQMRALGPRVLAGLAALTGFVEAAGTGGGAPG